MATSSKTISQSPRFAKNAETSPVVRPRLCHKYADTPASNMNVGAQRCVIQRVKNKAGQERVKSSGEKTIAAEWKNSRVWSSAMITITSPRTMSTDAVRGAVSSREVKLVCVEAM